MTPAATAALLGSKTHSHLCVIKLSGCRRRDFKGRVLRFSPFHRAESTDESREPHVQSNPLRPTRTRSLQRDLRAPCTMHTHLSVSAERERERERDQSFSVATENVGDRRLRISIVISLRLNTDGTLTVPHESTQSNSRRSTRYRWTTITFLSRANRRDRLHRYQTLHSTFTRVHPTGLQRSRQRRAGDSRFETIHRAMKSLDSSGPTRFPG